MFEMDFCFSAAEGSSERDRGKRGDRVLGIEGDKGIEET